MAEAKVDDLVFGLLYQHVEPDAEVGPNHVHEPKPGNDAVAADGNLKKSWPSGRQQCDSWKVGLHKKPSGEC